MLVERDEAENFSVLRPPKQIPFAGLWQTIGWSIERGEAA